MRSIIFNRVYIISILISVILPVITQKIHEIMTQEELVQTFGRYDKLPEYEVVPIYYSHINKRSTGEKVFISLQALGTNIKVWLEPVDEALITDATPVYGISENSNTNIPDFTKYKDAFKSLRPYVYRDQETNTTIAVDLNNNRRKRMIGVIGSENLLILPLHEHLIGVVARHRRSIDNISESQFNEYHYHIVFKSSTNNIFKPLPNILRRKRAIQDTIYPEILVIVEHSLYKKFNEIRDLLLLYLIAFWNGVDLLYQPLQNPKFRLNIASIIIAEDAYALSYIASNKVGNEKLKADTSLAESKFWLYENIPLIMDFDDYDVAVTMTTFFLCDWPANDGCQNKSLGVAVYSKVCEVDHENEKVSKTAIVVDSGVFDGVFVAAHELAHSFGADHDGVLENVRCFPNGSTMMNAIQIYRYDEGLWSECTLDQFGRLLETSGRCLLNQPKYDKKLIRILPGQLMNANEQCRWRFKTTASFINATSCEKLWCHHYSNKSIWLSMGPAIDGTTCDDNKICVHGRCILNPIARNS